MNKKIMITFIVLLSILLLWVAGSKFFLRNIEILGYEVLEKNSEYEIREYKPYLVAQTQTSSDFKTGMNGGFRVLADYIFGNNTKNNASESIAMTSPVITASEPIAMTSPVIRDKGNSIMEFVLPAEYNLENLPKPNNEAVKIIEKPGGIYAVIRYTGFGTEKSKEKNQEKLISALDKNEVSYDINTFSSFYYDPPSSFPWVRRNEVLIQINQ